MGEERWNTWMVFECSNIENHPADSQLGVAVLTNGVHGQQLVNAMADKVCSVCEQPFLDPVQETALTLFLQHDIDRFKLRGLNIMKDEEILWK